MFFCKEHKYISESMPLRGFAAVSDKFCFQYSGELRPTKHSKIQMLFCTGTYMSSHSIAAVISIPFQIIKIYFCKLKTAPHSRFVDPTFFLKTINISFAAHLKRHNFSPTESAFITSCHAR